ncbi:MAG: chemotaxis protein CheW [Verrucomicrobiota bacterium]
MSQPEDRFARRLAELRQQFDTSFAAPRRNTAVPQHKLLAIRLGEGDFALRLEETAGIYACPKVVPLPAATSGLLGIVGVRGRLLAVYRLATLLGVDPGSAPLRWLVVTRADDQLALAVDSIEAYLHVGEAELHPRLGHAAPGDEFYRELLSFDSSLRPVISVAALVAAIRKQAHAPLASEET